MWASFVEKRGEALEYARGDDGLGRAGDGNRVRFARGQEKDLVLLAVEPDPGTGDVVGDEEVGPLVEELSAGVPGEVVRFGREGDDHLSVGPDLPHGGEDVGGQHQADLRDPAGSLDLPGRERLGLEVGGRGGHDERVR